MFTIQWDDALPSSLPRLLPYQQVPAVRKIRTQKLGWDTRKTTLNLDFLKAASLFLFNKNWRCKMWAEEQEGCLICISNGEGTGRTLPRRGNPDSWGPSALAALLSPDSGCFQPQPGGCTPKQVCPAASSAAPELPPITPMAASPWASSGGLCGYTSNLSPAGFGLRKRQKLYILVPNPFSVSCNYRPMWEEIARNKH